MAHFKRRRPRILSSGYYSAHALDRRLDGNWGGRRIHPGDRKHWTDHWPANWDRLHHTRPRRRETRRLEHAVVMGADHENISWPLARKPHEYYW